MFRSARDRQLRIGKVGRVNKIVQMTPVTFAEPPCSEVDYAGDTLEWIELSSGEIRKAYVFVAGLGFSQLLFAWGYQTA